MGITKQMQKIRDRLPNNAFEAEMLELAGVDIFDQLDEEESPPNLKKPRFDEVEKDLPQKVADNSAKRTFNNNITSDWENRKKIATQQENARMKEKKEREEKIVQQKNQV